MARWLTAFFLALMLAVPTAAVGERPEIKPGTFPMLRDTLPPEQAKAQKQYAEQALRQLKPQRRGVTDTYVIVIALWNDPVFQSEAEQAAAILSQRYDSEGRTLILTVGIDEALPEANSLAGPAYIQQALKKVGRIIDPKEDLVVVFVTSHGFDTGEVGLQRGSQDQDVATLGAMTPGWLAKRMDAAKIDTRLVIVSACFSGSFVPYFNDDGTAVFTAASATRSSFGCNPERHWTYFGDALFNHALRGGVDFELGQAEALRLITKWEFKERLRASNPQGHIGSRAAVRIRAAEAYGRAVSCAADLSHVIRLSEAGKPAAGAPATETAKAALTTHLQDAETLGKARGYDSDQVSAHIDQAIALPAFGNGFDNLGWRAGQCIAG